MTLQNLYLLNERNCYQGYANQIDTACYASKKWNKCVLILYTSTSCKNIFEKHYEPGWTKQFNDSKHAIDKMNLIVLSSKSYSLISFSDIFTTF